MILNPSHEITLKGLPSEILDAYVRYKKGSRAIVAWLIQFGPKKYKGVKTLPIKELASLAQSVVGSVRELPEVIHFHFKETIAARKRLSQYFRKSIDVSEDDADTVNHEHFTTSLNKIYSDLCEHCQTCDAHKSAKHHGLNSTASAEPGKNHYACLLIEDSLEALDVNDQDPACDQCHHEQAYQCSGASTDLEIEHDEMSTAIETASALERVHEILMVARTCWQRAGAGEAHFVAATGATNVAWSALRELETQLKEDEEVLSLQVLHRKCCLFKDAAGDTSNALSKVYALLESLVEADRAINHYSNCHKLTVFAHCPSCIQKPGDYVQQITNSVKDQTGSFSQALMENILHLMCGTRPTDIILQSSPVFAEVGYLLTHREDKTTSFRCVLGLHLLTTAYRAYLFALPKPTTISTSRITALKLANQASASIAAILNNKDSFPCRCSQTLAFHLSNLKDDMDAYAKHRAWDLYFQSPWVSGNHMIEMLDRLSYYGMRLFHYRHYVGAVLHSYNVLVQLGGLDRIPALEQLCEVFQDTFFPSGRPAAHFKNAWARYIGARLRFKKGHRRHGTNRESWCMAVPAHAARNAAGLGIDSGRGKLVLEPKFDYAKIDPMMKLKQVDWRADLSAENCGPYNAHPLSAIQDTLNSQVRGSASKLLPLTIISHTAVFATILALIDRITTKTHTDPNERETKLCICFAHTILAGADRIIEGRRFGGVECWRKEEREVVTIVKNVLEVEFVDGVELNNRSWRWET